jgi:hypothetical protein
MNAVNRITPPNFHHSRESRNPVATDASINLRTQGLLAARSIRVMTGLDRITCRR